MALSAAAVAYTAVGGLVCYSGIKGATLADTAKGVLSGNLTLSDTETVDFSSPSSGGDSTTSGTVDGKNVKELSGVSKTATLSESQIKTLWTDNGGDSSKADYAYGVAMAESGGNPVATSSNPDGGINVGLYQLDTKGVGSGYSETDLKDPGFNTAITVLATKNGTDWSEWADPYVAANGTGG